MIMLALGLASGIMAGLANRNQAKAQAAVAQLQQQNANFQQQWEIDRQNRNILRQYEAAAGSNFRLTEAAIKDRARQELDAAEIFNNTKSQFSRNMQQTNAAMLSSFAGKGIDPNSGSARAILASNLRNASKVMGTIKGNYRDTLRDIETSYENRLGQRINLDNIDLIDFIPDTTATADFSRSMLAQGIIGGALQGLQGEAAAGDNGLFRNFYGS